MRGLELHTGEGGRRVLKLRVPADPTAAPVVELAQGDLEPLVLSTREVRWLCVTALPVALARMRMQAEALAAHAEIADVGVAG